MKTLVQYITEALLISEGGHVFDGGSDKISKADIKPTLDAYLSEIKRLFPKVAKYYENITTLGSVGKKDFSGDIDIAVDSKGLENCEDWNLDKQHIVELYEKFRKRARTSTPDKIMRRAVITGIGEYINSNSDKIITDTKQAGSGMLFSQFRQIDANTNKENGKTVQIDTMFGDVDWLNFAYYSDVYEGNVKGLHRTQLILHLFSYKGYTFKHEEGIYNKETKEKIAEHPEQVVELLNKLYNWHIDRKILSNYNKLIQYMKDNMSEKEYNGVIDIYLKTLDSTRCDIPDNLQAYWTENQDRLGLKGKFLPEDSNLYPLRK